MLVIEGVDWPKAVNVDGHGVVQWSGAVFNYVVVGVFGFLDDLMRSAPREGPFERSELRFLWLGFGGSLKAFGVVEALRFVVHNQLSRK